jgi:hypothetical protein
MNFVACSCFICQQKSVADPGCLSRIPDPDKHQRIYVFLTQKMIRDVDPGS